MKATIDFLIFIIERTDSMWREIEKNPVGAVFVLGAVGQFCMALGAFLARHS